ncbi:MAG TPA: DUF493 domain-containing protein [Candidatus Tenderia sp.]|nr:DUF493 domain-containing protein [Candidatus Tenderia sp.]
MSNTEETLLEFPCQFPIKAMGLADDDFDALVVSIVRQHVEDINEGAVKTRASSNGKYMSVTVTFTAHNKDQIDNIYLALTGHDRVMTVL